MAAFESTDISVEKLFRDFYVVPDYQREYVWSANEVKTMLDDIYNEQSEDSKTEYFIGAIVVCPNEESSNTFDLIDGQQRITTLFIAMCAIRDRMREIGVKSLSGVKKNIADTYTDENGDDQLKAHLESQYADSRDVLIKMINGEKITSTPTKSIKNIKTAYETIYKFLVDEFDKDDESLKKFFAYFIRNVKIIKISTDSLAKALTVFETMNHRGISLNHMDLLKNLVFMKTNESQYDELKAIWKDITDSLYKANENDPIRFLRLFIVSNWGVIGLKKSDTYNWIQKNNDKTKLDSDPIGFAQKLRSSIIDYQKFRENKNVDGTENDVLKNISFLYNNSPTAKKYLVALLAAKHFNIALFNRFCNDLESYLFVYIISSGEAMTPLEFKIAKWCRYLNNINTDEEYNVFREENFIKAKREMARTFNERFRTLTGIKKYRIDYILAKLTQVVDKHGYDDNIPISQFCKNHGVHVEHILPVNPSEKAKYEFGDGWDNIENINSIGNLTLLEKSMNMSLGNKSFSEKRDLYAKSRFLLTKVIAEKPNIGNTAIDRAVENMEPFYEWNERKINRRSSYLTKLACSVWGVQQ